MIPILTQDHADALLDAARSLDEAPRTRQEQERLEAAARDAHRKHKVSRNGQASVIDAFNAAHSIDALLARHGYAMGTGGRFIRPGGKSESVSIRDGRSCHWSSNDPLNDGAVVSGCGVHDAFDVHTYFEHGGDVRAAVRAAAQLLGMTMANASVPPTGSWPDPLPLPDGLPPVMPFDFALLPASLEPWIRDISERMQCPVDFCAATAMIVGGALIGRKVGIRPKRQDDWQVTPNLFGTMVGRPSLMKSPAMKEVLRFTVRLEMEAKEKHRQILSDFKKDEVIKDATRKVKSEELKKAIKSGGDAEAIAEQIVADQEEGPPPRQRYLVNDTTVEKLGEILNQNPNGVLVFFDELISFLRNLDRDGHEADRGFYLTAWDGDKRFTYDRIGRGTIDIEAAIVSIVGSIQPGVIADYIRGAVMGGSGDDGLMQRFQMSVYPDPPPTWRNVDRYPDTEAKSAAFAAFQRLADITADAAGAERDLFDLDSHTPFLRFDEAAQDIFNPWREDLEQRLRDGSEHPALEAHLAKYRSLIPSLALIIHLLDGGSGPIGVDSIQRANGWSAYLESHARRIYACVTQAPALAARQLARRIYAGDVTTGFSARDVYRNCWTGLDRESTAIAIDVLIGLKWLEEREEITGGRRTTRYAINPKVALLPRSN